MNSKDTLDELVVRIAQLISDAERLQNLRSDELNERPHENGWNALECLEHLNRYSTFYLGAIDFAITNAKHGWEETYKPSWLGNKSAMDMLPQDGKLKSTMKTFKSKNPTLDGIAKGVLEKFIADQSGFLKLIDASRKVSLGQTKSKTTLPLIKFNLGDTLRFVIYHEVRHMVQAFKACGIYENSNSQVA